MYSSYHFRSKQMCPVPCQLVQQITLPNLSLGTCVLSLASLCSPLYLRSNSMCPVPCHRVQQATLPTLGLRACVLSPATLCSRLPSLPYFLVHVS